MTFVRNEGSLDRILRIASGLGFLWLTIVERVPGWGLVGVAGLILLVTGITGYCPTYRLFNIDTHRGRLHPDDRDAGRLVRLLRLGEFTAIRAPSPAEEGHLSSALAASRGPSSIRDSCHEQAGEPEADRRRPSKRIISHHSSSKEPEMFNRTGGRALAVLAGVVLVLTVGAGVVLAAGDDDADTPIPVEPDGGIGDTPIPVEPDGGIGDTPGQQIPVEQARDDAHGLLGRYEIDLPADVRIGRRGSQHLALTEDYQLGRFTVALDDEGEGYRVTSVTVELPDGPETFLLTPG